LHVDFIVETIPANRKTNLSNFDANSVISFRIEILQRSKALSTVYAECSARRFQCPNNRCKSQNAMIQISTKTLLFRTGLRYYGVYTLSPLHSTRQTYCLSISVAKQSLQIANGNLSNLDENSVISIRIETLRHSKALSTLFDTPNIVHVDFSIETSAAYRKTQSFKYRRKLCYFVPD
jgi:hypothetical protein